MSALPELLLPAHCIDGAEVGRNGARFVPAAVRVDNASVFKQAINRVVGPPPKPEATRAERLRWVRKFYRFNPVAIVIVVILALLGRDTFLWIVAAAVAVIWLAGLASISLSIHKADSSSR